MPYDFDTPVNRRGTDSVKWAFPENLLPMWVADMDFKAAPEILEDLNARLSHGVFGYVTLPGEWYSSYINWWERRHGLLMEKENLLFCLGVIPGIAAALRALTCDKDYILLQTPAYSGFLHCLEGCGKKFRESPLILEHGRYSMDFDDLERQLALPDTKMFILCNPHNPTGNIWSREDLARVGELCKKHGVTVISDEIHCDLTEPGHSYVPFASVSETCRSVSMTFISPSKAFNLAGLKSAAVYASDPDILRALARELGFSGAGDVNALAPTAAISAFTKGEPWLDALRAYISDNRRRADGFLKENLPCVRLLPSLATYLLWLDVREVTTDSREFDSYLKRDSGLFISGGHDFRGDGFMRLNIACPKETLMDGLSRLKTGTQHYIAEKRP